MSLVVGNTKSPAGFAASGALFLVRYSAFFLKFILKVYPEIFPLEGREVGMTINTMINWTFVGLVMNYALSFMLVPGYRAECRGDIQSPGV